MKSLAIMLLAVMAIGTTSQAYELDDFVRLDSPSTHILQAKRAR